MEVGPERRSPELVRGVGESPPPRRWEMVLLVAILLTAAFFRLYRLEAAPPGLQHDEVFHGHDASVVLQGAHRIYFESNTGNEPLFVYLMAGTIALFGSNYLGIRLAAVLCGLAAIVFTYLLARKAFSYRVALLTSAGLAVSLLAGVHEPGGVAGRQPAAYGRRCHLFLLGGAEAADGRTAGRWPLLWLASS